MEGELIEELREILRKSWPEALGSLISAAVIFIVTYIIKNWLIGILLALILLLALMLRWLWLWRKKKESISLDDDETTDAMKRLKSELDTLHDLLDCPFCLVGGVYLDINVSPIRTTDLEEDEWMDIDPIEYDIGGSTLWVGRFLWEKGQKSYLFSAIGSSDDPLTKEFKKLIKHERRSWLQNKLITGIPNSRTAVTVHLSVKDEIE